MVNSVEFAERLQHIMDHYTLNASSFAERIGVQRSGISHILAGRNKPSLDFVLKVVDTFTEVDLYWLLLGKGNFPPANAHNNALNNKADDPLKTIDLKTPPIQKKIPFSETQEKKRLQNDIVKIIILYKNGSFDSFEN